MRLGILLNVIRVIVAVGIGQMLYQKQVWLLARTPTSTGEFWAEKGDFVAVSQRDATQDFCLEEKNDKSRRAAV